MRIERSPQTQHRVKTIATDQTVSMKKSVLDGQLTLSVYGGNHTYSVILPKEEVDRIIEFYK